MDHVSNHVCECKFCIMINAMWGDPLLSPWERSFVESVSRAGWSYEYTTKQKTKITEIFNRMLLRRGIEKQVL